MTTTSKTHGVSAASFRGGMRCLAGAVTVVASSAAEERGGLTATAVCSFSLTPPRLLACVNLQGSTFRLIAASRRMSVNVLARHQEPLARRFAGMSDAAAGDRFLDGDWCELSTGAPVLRSAIAAFDCAVEEMFVAQTHAIIIGEVKDVLLGTPQAPLLYHDGQFTTIFDSLGRWTPEVMASTDIVSPGEKQGDRNEIQRSV